MTRRRVAKINIGPQRALSRAPGYPDEANYVNNMVAQSKSLTDTILAIFNQIKDASPDILMDSLSDTFDLSQEYCPVLSGALKESGYLEVTDFRSKPRVEMGYAKNNNPPYAVVVHENLEWRHDPPTQAKFLEDALNQTIGDIWANLEASYGELIGAR